MSEPTSGVETRRLAPRPGEAIDRTKRFSFTFNGQSYGAHPGDTIASALAAAGVTVFSRSFKYHRPRGLLCNAGHCPNCLVQVGDEPSVRSCTRPVEEGMVVSSQNAWPSLERDVMTVTRLGDRFLPVGFYYKTFIRPRFLWPAYERILRNAAGLGRIEPDTPPGAYDKQYLHADVVVVGGGPAGLSAALAAAQQGARTLLFDDGPALGGHLRFASRRAESPLPELLASVEQQANLGVYSKTTVLGWYEDNWLSAAEENRLYKIRAGSVVFATGAYQQPLLFDNNDLPGIMLGEAVQRLLHLYGVAPGRQAVVVTANDDGWAVAADLLAAGILVAAVVDERLVPPYGLAGEMEAGGTAVFKGYTIAGAEGDGAVQQVTIVPVDEHGQISSGARQSLACDLVAVSVAWEPASGLIYQANGRLAYVPDRGEYLPDELPAGIYAAGRVTGSHALSLQLAEGSLAGRQAAAHVGLGVPVPPGDLADLAAGRAAQPRRTSTLVRVPGRQKQFLCYCEDVTQKDLELSIAEGYDSMELLKRYSTISMGPCQGKMCSRNAVHLAARANGRTIKETGLTTARPPTEPVSLGVLAGMNMEPVKVTPVHDWHLARGARMMTAGLWMRPEHYGDPVAEVQAVRQRVGLIDVSTLGKLRFTGPGVPDLLSRLYANRWDNLAAGRVRYGVMCNDEGVILDDGVTARVGQEEWYTTTTSSGASAIYEWIQWWMQSGWGQGVHLTNLTEVNAAFNLAGPRSREVLQQLTEADLSNEAMPYLAVRDVALAGAPCRLLRIGFTGELSYEIHCPAGYGLAVWEALMAAGQASGIMPFGVEAQRVLRLEKAHIIVGQDTDALSDPISADMAWAVKLDKGNFLGQRPLSRIARDGPAQKLVGFRVAAPGVVPEEGLQIIRFGSEGNLEIVGWVTSSRHSPTLGETIGMCWLPADMAERHGNTFTILRQGSLVPAQVHHGAFYDPSGERLRS
jgi:sarcosine oxidase, subunit alpha